MSVVIRVGYFPGAACQLLTAVASLAAREHEGPSEVAANGLSCSTAYGIFPDQGSNPRLLHW